MTDQQSLSSFQLIKSIVLLIVLFCLVGGFRVDAQSLSVSSTNTNELTVYDLAGSSEVRIFNQSGSQVTNVTVEIALPQGIEYNANSITAVSVHSFSEQNISNSSNLQFSCSNISPGDTAIFNLTYNADCDAVSYQIGGGVFRNGITVNYDQGTDQIQAPAYNILYPALSVLSVSPKNNTISSSSSYDRSITIINGGDGRLSNFFIVDDHPSELTLIGTDLGTINATNDTIFLVGSDFTSIGNGDAYLDQNESIVVTETISGLSCSDVTRTSNIEAGWGAANENCQSSTTFFNTTIDYAEPSLSLTTVETMSSCFGTSISNQQELRIQNNSSGYAKSITVDIFKSSGGSYDQNLLTRFDTDNITYKIDNGVVQSITPDQVYATSSSGDYACLGGGANGRFELSFDGLDPGSTIYIYWDALNCCLASSCPSPDIGGWKAEVDYTDACEIGSYSKNKVGQDPVGAYMTLFTESEPEIRDGEVHDFNFLVSSFENTLPEESTGYYELQFQIDPGLVFDSNADLVWITHPTVWTPTSVNYNSSTGSLIAQFPVPATFDIAKSEINLKLRGDCGISGVISGDKDVALQVYYNPDASCGVSCLPSLSCEEVITTYLRCPIACAEGLAFVDFDAARTSYGHSDNDQNGLADGTNSIDLTKIKTNRIMVGDTLTTTFSGVVHTSGSFPSWSYGYASSTIPLGSNLTAIDATVTVYDQSAATTKVCSLVPISSSGTGTVTFDFDFSPSTLASSCSAFSGFTFGDNDSVDLSVRYDVTGNIGAAIEEVTISNDFYVSEVANPSVGQQYSCDTGLDNITFIGYQFVTASVNNVSVNACQKTIKQSYYLGIGDCCSNYGGGNLFPYEYRNWAHVRRVKAEIPSGYELVDFYIQHTRTKSTNKTATQTVYLTPVSNINNVVEFDLEAEHEGFGGSLRLSDDGFHGTMNIVVAPTCDVPTGTWQDMTWSYDFQETEYLGGGTTGWLSINPDRLRFNPTSLTLSSTNPVMDGIERTVVWEVKVKNSTSKTDAANSWLHTVSPDGDVVVRAVIDQATGDTIQVDGDIYRLGDLNKNQTKTYLISAYYHACTPENLIVYAGYECSAYPNTFSEFTCPHTNMTLQVIPKPAQTQVRIAGATYQDDCNQEIEVHIQVLSVQLAHVDSVKVTMDVPDDGAITFVPGSAQFGYPTENDYSSTTNPDSIPGGYEYDVMDLHGDLWENGLPGVYQLDKNTLWLNYRLKMEDNFESGDFVHFNVASKNVCGDDLPDINVAFDPNFSFSSQPIADVAGEIGDSWSVSFGDYNGDGYDDIFVTEYDPLKPNLLFLNDTDGSFTKVTGQNIVTDLASSLASTWGDYDNDGDLDLFVANNIGYPNFLYQNNGDLSFTRIISGHITNFDGYCHGATWGDYDSDGFIDLFVADFMPTKFNLLYHNNGDGTFSQVTTGPVVTESNFSIGASWSDFDNDGDLDLFVPNVNDYNFHYRNDGNGVFVKLSNALTTEATNSVGSSWGDYNNDGWVDLFIANAGNQNNMLFQNDGSGDFIKITNDPIVEGGGNTHGSGWADFDNDGDLDLFATNDQNGSNFFYTNNGDGSFTQIISSLDEDKFNSFGVAWSDLDQDGDLDFFVANHSNQENNIYTNAKGKCSNSICLKLEGLQSNRSAIGAKVSLFATINGQFVEQYREVSSQTSGGAGGQSTMNVVFGLGDAIEADSIKITWPSGVVQVLYDEPVGNCTTILETLGSRVCGSLYHDANANCIQDAGEESISNQMIEITPGPKYVYTNELGEYETYLADGGYSIRFVDRGTWFVSCMSDTLQQVTVTGGGSNTYCGFNFGMSSHCATPNLSVVLATTVLRRGFANIYTVTIENNGGALATNVDFEIDFPEHMDIKASTIDWDLVNNNTYLWNFDSIQIGEMISFQVTDSVTLGVGIGDSMQVTARLATSNDCDTSDNVFVDRNVVKGSIDPNDKQVWPQGEGTTHRVIASTGLLYKIRFQNIGTYEATTVVVYDTLHYALDVSSIRDIICSHDFTFEIINNHVLKWTFSHIDLPTKDRYEPGSHGFAQFKIYPKENFVEGVHITNTAAIKFDFEDVIMTNTVFNEMYTVIPRSLGNTLITVYPQPAHGEITVASTMEGRAMIAYVLRTLSGTEVVQGVLANRTEFTLNVSGLSPSIYLLEITDDSGRKSTRRVVLK